MALDPVASSEHSVEAESQSSSGAARAAAALASIVGDSRAIVSVRERVETLGRYHLPLLLVGEPGTGKDLVARAIHDLSSHGGPFVKVRCATVSAATMREELAQLDRASTIYLDGIDDAPTAVLDELRSAFDARRLKTTSEEDGRAAARVIGSSRRGHVTDVVLPPELLAPIAGFTLSLPPLRERRADIAPLAQAFIDTFARRHGAAAMALSASALAALRKAPWPGNVRQLRAVIEAAVVLAGGRGIDREVVDESLATVPRFEHSRSSAPAAPLTNPPGSFTPPSFPSLRDMERVLILSAWTEHENNLSRAANHLGIPRSTLRDKLRRFGVL